MVQTLADELDVDPNDITYTTTQVGDDTVITFTVPEDTTVTTNPDGTTTVSVNPNSSTTVNDPNFPSTFWTSTTTRYPDLGDRYPGAGDSSDPITTIEVHDHTISRLG